MRVTIVEPQWSEEIRPQELTAEVGSELVSPIRWKGSMSELVTWLGDNCACECRRFDAKLLLENNCDHVSREGFYGHFLGRCPRQDPVRPDVDIVFQEPQTFRDRMSFFESAWMPATKWMA